MDVVRIWLKKANSLGGVWVISFIHDYFNDIPSWNVPHWEPYVEPVFETGGVVDIVGGHNYFAAIHCMLVSLWEWVYIANGYLYMWGKKANIPSGMKTKKKLVSPTLNPILADIGQVVQVACAKQRVVAVVRT